MKYSNINKLILLILMLIGAHGIYAQDIIRTKDGELIVAKKISIQTDVIYYQEYNADNSDKLSIPKNQVFSITYKDGTVVDVITKKSKNRYTNSTNNVVSFHLFDFVFSNLTISYERILPGGKAGIQIPFSIGYKDETTSLPIPLPIDSEYTNRLVSKFYSGINLNLYPTGQGKVKYFLGPSFLIGNGLYHEEVDHYSSYYPDPLSTGFFKLLLNNGIVFSPVHNLSFSIIGSLGVQYMTNNTLKKAETTGGLSINLSLRF